jgi:uncharacterized damage-inducible protein DinB
MASEKALIQKEIAALAKAKKALFEMLESLSEQEYTQQPAANAWSVAQTANHVFMSEQLSLAYLKKKLSYPETVPPYHFKSWLGVWGIKLVFATSWRRKAPKHINMWGDQPIYSRTELREKWDQLSEEMASFIHTHQEHFSRHLVYRHPFAGRMTMRQMLIFMHDHLHHHTRQVKKILQRIRKDI